MTPETIMSYINDISKECVLTDKGQVIMNELRESVEKELNAPAQKLYNCKKITLKCPKNFIPCNSSPGFKKQVTIDYCLKLEIEDLWKHGIKTTGCCCGHGHSLGYIGVTEDSIEKMLKLGYQHYIYDMDNGGNERKDAFIPKSTNHIYIGYSNGYLG